MHRWMFAVWLGVVLAGCQGGGEEKAEYPDSQRAFFALNANCASAYERGINEIQRSVAFNNCNAARAQYSKQSNIVGWTGVISSISTDQGADFVSLDIVGELDGFEIKFRTVSNRVSDIGSGTLITQENPLFSVLAGMRVGDTVTFDATFLNDPSGERGLWEASLTEQGSMDDPEFNVRFTSIRSYGSRDQIATTPENSMKSGNAGSASAEAIASNPDKPSVPRVDESSMSGRDVSSELDGYQANEVTEEVSREVLSPSFDCRKAALSSEQTICSNSALARVDRYTADMYLCILERSSGDREALRAEQRKWIRERDRCADDVGCLRGAYGDIAEVYMKRTSFEDCQSKVAGGKAF